MPNDKYTSIVNLDFQYAHRFMNWPREASIFTDTQGFYKSNLKTPSTR